MFNPWRSLSLVFFGLALVSVGEAQLRVRTRTGAPRVLMVSPEQTGVLQTGGLAHATAGLVASLNADRIPTEVLMPYFLEMQATKVAATGETINVGLNYQNGIPHKSSAFSVHRGEHQPIPPFF